jgi:hypothetical protein
MKKFIIEGKAYYTNITELDKIKKCIDFYKSGCTNYALSFGNIDKHIIKNDKCKGKNVKYLRNMNFEECFLPAQVAMEDYSEDVLKKGFDLIELI